MLPDVDGDHGGVVVVPELPLFDAIFIAGLYHDLIKNRHVPFTRDCFPDRVSSTCIYSLEYLFHTCKIFGPTTFFLDL